MAPWVAKVEIFHTLLERHVLKRFIRFGKTSGFHLAHREQASADLALFQLDAAKLLRKPRALLGQQLMPREVASMHLLS